MASISVVDAFECAKKEFLRRFANGTTYDFTSFPTIDHVYRAAKQLQKQQAETRSMRNLNKIQPFLETLRHYGSVVDTFVQVKPGVLALIWGPISFLLLISSTFYSIHDKILEAMNQIGIALPTFQQYMELFPNNNKMHQALCLFYRDILDFYAALLEVFKHNKWSTLFKSLWPRYLGRIQVIQRNMEQHRSLMNNEATLAHLVQAQADRERALEEYEQQFDFRQRQEFDMVMNSLNARLYDQELESLKRNSSLHSGDWLEEHPIYREWTDVHDKSSRLLWLQGIPGAGKTFLSSFVVQNIQAKRYTVAFVFLNYRFHQYATALKVLQSVTAQLILDNKEFRNLLISAHNDSYRRLNSSIDFARDLLKQILDCLSKPFILIDGLDEMHHQERTILLQIMLELLNQNQELRILLSSRPEDDITRLLTHQTPSIRVHDANRHDIETYVDIRASSWISELSTSLAQAQVIKRLMQKVAINSQGMFLYARLLCDTVVLKGDVASLKEAVDNLPDGLNEAYHRILSNIESLGERERDESRQILSLIASSTVPLTSNEIQLAIFTARTGDTTQGCESLFLNILRRCGPIVEEMSGNVQFVHFTVYEYLLGSQSNFYLKDAETHALISSISMKYLGSACFDPELPDNALKQCVLNGAYVLENYVCMHWLDHLRNSKDVCSNSQIQLANTLASTRRNPMYSGDQASARDQSNFDFIGESCQDFADAYAFSKIRRRDLCFSNDELIQMLDPFTFSTTQLRVRSTLESILCDTARHRDNCSCSALKSLYGDDIYKCGRPGCPFFRIGFATKSTRNRHMEAHSRPFKCDFQDCAFWDLGFPTQALLTTHHAQFHSQKLVKTGPQNWKRSKRQELKLILIDAVKEDDLQTIQDMWDAAKPFGAKLLLTAIQEQSSNAMLMYLIEHVSYGRFPFVISDTYLLIKHRPVDLQRIFLAALSKGNCEIFRTFNIQQFCFSFKGELIMINIIGEVAGKRNPDIVELVSTQVPPTHFADFVKRIIPFRPSATEELSALECLRRIKSRRRLGEMVDLALKETGARCCSLLLAKFLVAEGANPNGIESFNGHTPIFAASGKMSREAAEFIKYLFDVGANVDVEFQKQKLSERPAIKTFHQWLGVTWDELVASR